MRKIIEISSKNYPNLLSKGLGFLIFAFFLLVPLAHTQEINSTKYVNNPDGSQVLLNHVPLAVVLGHATKLSHVNANQMLELRVMVQSKDPDGMKSFINELYDPKSPNYHRFLTPDEFTEMFGASAPDLASVKQYLKDQGFFVEGQSKSGYIIRVRAQVSVVEPTFAVTINQYKALDGTTFIAPAQNPTVDPRIAGKVYAILGLDNMTRSYPTSHRKILLKGNAKDPITSVNLPLQAEVSTTLKLNENITPNIGLKPQTGPLPPSGLNAQTGNSLEAELFWTASSGATSYNVYRANSSGAEGSTPFQTGVTTPFFTDTNNGNLLTDGTTYYYEVTAVEGGVESGKSNEVNVTPYGLLGYGGSTGPSDIAKIYNLSSVTSNGSGQTLGLFEEDGYISGDILVFESYYNITPVTLTPILNTSDGATGTPGADADNVATDIDMAVAVAPGLSSIRVYETVNTAGGWIDQWADIADDPLAPKVISCQWGLYEAASYNYFDESVFSELATEGVTVFAAAGDAGAYDNCDPDSFPSNCNIQGSPGTGILSVQYPASSEYVTGVGASYLTVNNPGVSGETYNNETASLFGGGGISSEISLPSYQTVAAASYYSATDQSFGSTTMRNVPDVALAVDPLIIYGIYASDQSPPTWYGISGSAISSVVWAAFTTRVNQGRVAAGESTIGWLNPVIYLLAQGPSYTNDFHNISSQFSSSYSDNSYYPAEVGYNVATGLGSFNGAYLYNDLLGPVPPTNLTATAGSAQVVLNWTASTGTIASYNVERSTTSGGPYTTISTSGQVTGTSYTDTSATNGTTYYYVVVSVDASLPGAESNQVSAIPVATPTGVTAQAGNATVGLSWNASAGATSYNIYRGTSTGGESSTALASVTSPTVSYTDNSAGNGTTYYYEIKAVNATGISASSSEVNATPVALPSAPNGVTATESNAQVVISWNASTGAASYNIYRGTSSGGESSTAIGSVTSPTVSYTDTSLTNGTTYYYEIKAVNADGSSAYSSEVSGIPIAAPTGVTATYGSGQVGLSWTASTGASSYNIYRGTNSGEESSTALASVTSPTVTFTDTSVVNGTNYYYKVKAVNADGTSAYSFEVGTTPIAPPTGVTAQAGNATVALNWSASAGASSYNIYRGTSSGGESSTALASVTSPTVTYTDTSVANRTTYYYEIKAVDGSETTAYSSEVNASPVGAPSPPTGVAAQAGNAQVVLNWSASSGATSYNIYRGTSSGGESSTALTTVTSPTVSYTDISVSNGTTYYYEIKAANAGGTSSSSSEVNASPLAPPQPPTGFSTTYGNGQVTLNWTASATAATYYIYRGTSSGGESSTAVGSVTSPTVTYTDTSVSNGTTYYYEIKAANVGGMSSESSESSSTPEAPVNGVCGSAAQTYVYNVSTTPAFLDNFEATLCKAGTPNPYPVTFPVPGSSVTWSCQPIYGGELSSSCEAQRNKEQEIKL